MATITLRNTCPLCGNKRNGRNVEQPCGQCKLTLADAKAACELSKRSMKGSN